MPDVRISIRPEQLRAAVVIGGASCVQLEVTFPPQYPHKPPTVLQVAPDVRLPCWRYEGRSILAPRLEERGWSSALGVADIVRELVEGGWGACGGFRAPPGPPLIPLVPLMAGGRTHCEDVPAQRVGLRCRRPCMGQLRQDK